MIPQGFACDRLTTGPVQWSTGQPPFDADLTLWSVGRVRPNNAFIPKDMLDEHGFDEGTARTEDIFSGLLRGGPDVASSYDEAILADDDDGDLANGTPNECAIVEAFGNHGLGPLGTGSPYRATFQPPGVHDTPEVGFPIEITVQSSASNCFEVMPVRRWPPRTSSGRSLSKSSCIFGLWSHMSICEGAPDMNR